MATTFMKEREDEKSKESFNIKTYIFLKVEANVALMCLGDRYIEISTLKIEVVTSFCKLLDVVPGGTSGKESTCQCGRHGFNPWVGKIPEEGTATPPPPPQYSCLENHTDRDAWQATAHRLPKSWTRLKRLGTNAQNIQIKIGHKLHTTLKNGIS